jgi:hypothetical protein
VITLTELNAALYLAYSGEFPSRKPYHRGPNSRDELKKALSQLHGFVDGTLGPEKHEQVAKHHRLNGRHDAKLKLSKLNGISRMLTKQDNLKRWKANIKKQNLDTERFGKFPAAKAATLKYVKIPENQSHLTFWKGIWKEDNNYDERSMESALENSGLQRIKGTAHNKPIKHKEIYYAVQSTSPWKAPGPDGVHGYLVKKLQGTLISILARLYNELWNGKEKPPTWFTAGRTILFHKNDDAVENPANYRPITMLNTLYKVYTSVLQR